MTYTIPLGQKMKIRYYGADTISSEGDLTNDVRKKNWNYINGQSFLVSGSINIAMTSEFKSVSDLIPHNADVENTLHLLQGFLGSIDNNLASKASSIASTTNKVEGFRYWTGTSPLTVSGLKVMLYSDGNAYTDVVEPMKALMKCVLPVSNDQGQLMGPGPGVQEVFDKLRKTSTIGSCSVSIGGMYFSNVIFTQAQPIIGTVVDENGYPIKSEVNLEFSTMEIAHSQMIDGIFTQKSGVGGGYSGGTGGAY